ncbi:MAG TPA: transcriptional regulator [Cellvibrio sp.]|nr:transcriptional regulator [Cellvibrio sp.]
MANLDEVIHQSTRLKIMTALQVLQEGEWIEFVKLRTLTSVSDGNLGAHLETLAKADYVAIEKQFVGKKPQTRIRITAQGRSAYRNHIAELKTLLRM